MAHLSVALLGTPSVMRDGEPTAKFRSQRTLALLAFLATEADRVHPRNMLAALLWPESPDRTALNNLRTALANLRKAIGDAQADPPFLLISRDSLCLNPAADVTVDVAEFQQLVARAESARKAKPPSSGLGVASNLIDELEVAVALYRGSFLEGFSIPSIEFQDWALLWQERLHERMVAALRWLADLCEDQGEWERAIHHVRRLLALEPLDEEGHRYLMRLLARCGQRN
ncbi:MAG: winged helix-turn-helix domain-containing protein [Anaerolineae bacterium]|nr:winged helix-turn-helix domain-containing protein [Anaerolineae bacterium]